MERDQMKFAVFWKLEVCTSTYQYIPVCTSMYLELTKLEAVLKFYLLTWYPMHRRCTTYWYKPVRTIIEIVY